MTGRFFLRPLRRTPAVLALVLACATSGCDREAQETAAALTGGDPHRGRLLIREYGCHTCHTVPGVRGAGAVVGPSLERVAVRNYLAGELTNTPENMVRWIRSPQSVRAGTAMPDTGVGEPDARDIAAYLYTLR